MWPWPLTFDLEHVSHVALHIGISFTKLNSVNLVYLFLVYNDFTADTLRQAVTLTFDSLTLNLWSVLVVTWSNTVPYLTEIEQSSAEL